MEPDGCTQSSELMVKVCSSLRWLIFAAVLVLLVSQLGKDLHGSHIHRQTLVVLEMEKMMTHGVIGTVDYYAKGTAALFDFPVFQAMGSTLAQLLGLEAFKAARLLGLLVFIAGYFVLAKLMRLAEPRRLVADLTLIFYCLAPIQVFYSSAPVSDSLACLLALLAILAFERLAVVGPAKVWYLLLLSSAFASTLIKMPVFLPAAVLISIRGLQRYGLRVLRRAEYLGVGAAVVGAAAIYLWVAHHVNQVWEQGRVYGGPINDLYWFFSNYEDRTTWAYYAKILGYLSKYLLNPLSFALCLGGFIFYKRKYSFAAPMLPWLLGSLVTLLIFFNLQWRHEYYQLPFVAPLCYFTAVGSHRFLSWCKRWSGLEIVALLLLVLASAYFSGKYILRLQRSNAEEIAILEDAGSMLRTTTYSQDFIVYLVAEYDMQPQHLYFAKRDGLMIAEADLDQSLWTRILQRYKSEERILVFCPSSLRNLFSARARSMGLSVLVDEPTGLLYSNS